MQNVTVIRIAGKALLISAVLQVPFWQMLGTFPHGIGFLIAFVFFAPSLYIVQHMPPPFNFSGDIPRHGETGAVVEIVVLQILILGTILFALLAFNAWLSPKLTQGPKQG